MKKAMRQKVLSCAAILLSAILFVIAAGCAPEPAPAPSSAPAKLPDTFVMAALPSGSIGYAMMVGVGEAIKQKSGIPLRLIPGATDVARIEPVLKKEAHVSLLVGASTFGMTHGIGDVYSKTQWGPQPLRVVWNGTAGGSSMVVRGDIGVKTMADLKGKRLGVVPGNLTFDTSRWGATTAALAYGNLKWADVKQTTVSGSVAIWQGILDGSCDSGWLSAGADKSYELASSKFGIWYPPMPPTEKEAWARFQKVAPYLYPEEVSVGAGPQFAGGKKLWMGGMAYTICSYNWSSQDISYALAKAVWEGWDLYKTAHPSLIDWTHECTLQYKRLVHPYDEGTVKFFKEIKAWTPDMDRWQKKQVDLEKARLEGFGKAKAAAEKQNIKLDTPQFSEFWEKWLVDNKLISYPESQ